MKRPKLAILVVSLNIFCFLCGCQQFSAVMEYRRELSAQKRDLAIQRRNFKRVKNAIRKNRLSDRLNNEDIVKRYGEPVVIIDEEGIKRWVYSPGLGNIGAEKAYLYFKEDKLVKWEYLPTEKK